MSHLQPRGFDERRKLEDFIPVRLPVEWEYRGEPGLHPDIEGITGKEVVLLIEKDLQGSKGFLQSS